MNEIQIACNTSPWGPDGVIPAMNAIRNAGFGGIECPASVVSRYEDRLHVFEEILEREGLCLAGLVQPLDIMDRDKADEQVERAVNVARFAAAAGHGYLVVCQVDPVAQPPDEDGWITAAAVLEEVGVRCRKGGVALCFMPVARPLEMDEKALDRLMAMTPPDAVNLALDTAESFWAGTDIARMAKKHAARLKVVRFRDAPGSSRRGARGQAVSTPAFGRGAVRFEALSKALKDMDYSGWITLDVSGEAQDPKAAVANGFRGLMRKAGLLDP